MHWSELEARQPRLAATARRRLVEPGVLLVVTLRADRTPRLSPVEPFLLEGRLLLSMMWGSLKAKDLERDPRVLVHSIVTNRDGEEGELKVRGAALAVADRDLHERYAAAVGRSSGGSRSWVASTSSTSTSSTSASCATTTRPVTSTWRPGHRRRSTCGEAPARRASAHPNP
jgi:hypothetical protein